MANWCRKCCPWASSQEDASPNLEGPLLHPAVASRAPSSNVVEPNVQRRTTSQASLSSSGRTLSGEVEFSSRSNSRTQTASTPSNRSDPSPAERSSSSLPRPTLPPDVGLPLPDSDTVRQVEVSRLERVTQHGGSEQLHEKAEDSETIAEIQKSPSEIGTAEGCAGATDQLAATMEKGLVAEEMRDVDALDGDAPEGRGTTNPEQDTCSLKATQDNAARLEAEEEARLKAEEEARLKAEEEARLKAEEQARLKAEEQARLKAEDEVRLKAEEEARLKAEEDVRLEAEEARIKAEEEASLRAEEEARLQAEEARLKAEEEARLNAEEEAGLKAEEVRLKAEVEAKLKAEEQARLKSEEEASLRAEEEARLKAEEEARLKAEEAGLKAEEEARLKAEEQARLKAEEEARFKAEEARLKAEDEARLKAEEEAELKVAEEAIFEVEEEAGQKAEEKVPPWSLEQTFVVCGSPGTDWSQFESRAPLLDMTQFTSVRSAVGALNSDLNLCPGGICVVFSQTRQVYTVAYRSDKRAEARRLFGLEDEETGSEFQPTPRVDRSQTPRRQLCDPLDNDALPAITEPEGNTGFMGRLQAFMAQRITTERTEPEPQFDAAKLVMTRCIALQDRYDVLKELGTGVQGTTYLVRRKGTEHDCVAKETKNTSPEGVKTFLAEFNKMREFRHPNCIKVIELLENARENQIFIISEMAYGGDLYKYMEVVQQQPSGLTEQIIASLVHQAMLGVAFLHARGCMHNDLKPDNILVMDEYRAGRVPRVVVGDYGCATLRNNRLQVMFGDPRYQAPESLKAMLAYFANRSKPPAQQGPKTDVWSMGATLYELLSGGIIPFLYTRCPDKFTSFDDERWVQLRSALLSPDRAEVFPSCDGVSAKAEGILLRLLEKSPSKRPTAQDVLGDPWFAVQGGRLSCGILANVEFTATKSKARQILLNALATKMKTDHVKHCLKIFHSFDREKKGTISRGNFKQALETLGQDTRNADAIFERADIDRSGSLEFNEFVAMTYDWREEQKTGKLDVYLKEFLADLGAKEDGTISKEGLRNFFSGALRSDELQELETFIGKRGSKDILPADLRDFALSSSFFVPSTMLSRAED